MSIDFIAITNPAPGKVLLHPARVISMLQRAVFDTTHPLRVAGLSALEPPKGDDMAEDDAERTIHKNVVQISVITQHNKPVPIPKLPCGGWGFCLTLFLDT
jgi:hypothetical protein